MVREAVSKAKQPEQVVCFSTIPAQVRRPAEARTLFSGHPKSRCKPDASPAPGSYPNTIIVFRLHILVHGLEFTATDLPFSEGVDVRRKLVGH